MLAFQVSDMAKTPRKTKTLGCGATANNNKRRRREVDVAAIHIDDSKRQKVMSKPKSRVKIISVDEAAQLLCAIKAPSKTSSKTSPVKEALTRAQPYLLLKKKREAARASLLSMKKEIDNPEDNWETFEQLRMLCGESDVVMGSSNLQQFGVNLVLKKEEEEEEEEQDCSGAIKTPSSKEPLRLMIKRAQQKLLDKKREAARVSVLAMEKEIDNPEDNSETFEQLRMLCGNREVVMGSSNLQQFGVDLVLKKEEEVEEEEDCSCSGLSQLSAIKTPSSPPKPKLAITTIHLHLLLPNKSEAARRLLGMEKQVDIPQDYLVAFEKRIRMLGGWRGSALALQSLLLKKG